MGLMRCYLNQTRDVAQRCLLALASFASAAEVPEAAFEKLASMHPEFWRVPPAAHPSSRLLFWYARSARGRRAANALGFRGAHRGIDLRASILLQAARAF